MAVIKYVCKYCNSVSMRPVNVCPSCGAKEFAAFDENNVSVDPAKLAASRKKRIAVIVTILLIPPLIIGLLITAGVIFSTAKVISDVGAGVADITEDYKTIEYAFDESLLSDPKMGIGRNYDTSDCDYHISYDMTGGFDDLYEKVYKNIYTSQFRCFQVNVPCDALITEDDFTLEFTGMDIDYYNSFASASFDFAKTGNLPKGTSIYLIDSDGNKNKLMVEKYERNDYPTVADYINKKNYSHSFTLDTPVKPYSSIMIDTGDKQYTFELEYNRGNGKLSYYALQN